MRLQSHFVSLSDEKVLNRLEKRTMALVVITHNAHSFMTHSGGVLRWVFISDKSTQINSIYHFILKAFSCQPLETKLNNFDRLRRSWFERALWVLAMIQTWLFHLQKRHFWSAIFRWVQEYLVTGQILPVSFAYMSKHRTPSLLSPILPLCNRHVVLDSKRIRHFPS